MHENNFFYYNFYRPQGKVMFLQASVCPQGRGLPTGRGSPYYWGLTQGDPPPPLVTSSGSHCRGRYASYCNAFLYKNRSAHLHFDYTMDRKGVFQCRNTIVCYCYTNSIESSSWPIDSNATYACCVWFAWWFSNTIRHVYMWFKQIITG